MAAELGPAGERQKRWARVLELVRVEELASGTRGSSPSRPPESRATLVLVFDKAGFAVLTTGALVERLRNDMALRRIRGWENVGSMHSECQVPARARGLCDKRVGRALPRGLGRADAPQSHLLGHVSRDSTAISTREQPVL